MAFTLTSILDGTINQVHNRVDEMLEKVADSAIDGARGNSGAILAQFFQGFCDGSNEVGKHTPETFSIAIKVGADYAREALAEPTEGTILTVITDFSNELINLLKNKKIDFVRLLELGIQKAEESLQNTPNLLPILKKSGVVDSGAQGFVDLLNGIFYFINSGSIKDLKIQNFFLDESEKNSSEIHSNELKYNFCTECLINGDDIDRKKVREELMAFGDSLVIAGSKSKAKIHIHTNEPAKVFNYCSKYGIVSDQKTDDMSQQQASAGGQSLQKIAILTDSGADLPPESDSLNIHVVPVRYHFGNIGYIDKVSQSPQEFFQELKVNPIHPKTSQPTPGDFRRQYNYLSSHYKSVISIHLSKKLSGTLQSAHTASKRVPESRTTLIDSMTASVAQGLIVMYAAKLAKNRLSHDEITEKVHKIIPKTKVYLAIYDLTYPVRGGRLPKSVKVIADLLRIRPILTAKNGVIEKAGQLFGTKNLESKFARFIRKRLEVSKRYIIQIGHCNNHKGAELLKISIDDFKNIEKIYNIEMGCALGVHAGPGSISIGIQEIPND
ncbi:MAG: hypothetical protein CMF96_01335 [Candidatus Marinimicrobia bacterium]|mgnify:FL=1|nr:hypothetical protein [Candidatus Neomarinimicrobiota bacterium]